MLSCKHVGLAAAVFLLLSSTELFSYPCYSPTDCSWYATIKETQTETGLLPTYEALSAAINALNGAYKIYQEQLREQNRLYEQLVKLKQENAKSDSEKLFLMQKLNKLIGNTIDSEAVKKEVR